MFLWVRVIVLGVWVYGKFIRRLERIGTMEEKEVVGIEFREVRIGGRELLFFTFSVFSFVL